MKIETVEVPVPVMVPCAVVPPAEPDWATVKLAPEADIYVKVQALLAEIEQRRGYEVLLKAASSGCVQQQSINRRSP